MSLSLNDSKIMRKVLANAYQDLLVVREHMVTLGEVDKKIPPNADTGDRNIVLLLDTCRRCVTDSLARLADYRASVGAAAQYDQKELLS